MISQALSVALMYGIVNAMGVVLFVGIDISVKGTAIRKVLPMSPD